MAIVWGAYEGHLRVGIDCSITPASPSYADTKVTVTWKFYVGTDNWDWNDGQTANVDSSNWSGAAVNFQNTLQPYEKVLVRTQSVSYSISSNSGAATATINVTGAYNGATPSASRLVNLPDRPPGPPGAPLGRITTGITGTQATLDWSAPSGTGIDAYQLQVDDSSGFSSVHYSNASLTSPGPVTVTGLTPNRTYYWRVRAHNSAGWGPFDGTNASFTTAATNPPSVPGTPTVSARTNTTISAAWTASAANGGASLTYTAECATDAGFTTIVDTNAGLTSPSTTFTGLAPNTSHWVRVRATTTVGTSANSGALATATLPSATYSDAESLLGRIISLAEAIGEKMVHLGAHLHAEKSTTDTLSAGTPLAIAFDTAVTSMGPDGPTRSGGQFTCQYPGEYLIEFGVRFDESVASRNTLTVDLNGAELLSEVFTAAGSASTAHRVLTTSRRLAAGDDLDFKATASAGQTTGTEAYARVVMTGF